MTGWTEQNFYVYQGSLTRPECTADITWIVLEGGFYVPSTQVESVKQIFSDSAKSYLNGNARSEQQIQGRKIYMKELPPPSGAAYLAVAVSSILGLAATLF